MDLGSLTPDQLAGLKAQLGLTADTNYGRSPENRPRQLHDLRLKPNANDPRPTFFWSAESPRDQLPQAPRYYPALIWHQDTGEERTIHSADERASYGPLWASIPPSAAVVVDPLVSLQNAMEALTDEERTLILDAQKKDRLAALQAKLAGLSEAQLEALIANTEPKRRKKSA